MVIKRLGQEAMKEKILSLMKAGVAVKDVVACFARTGVSSDASLEGKLFVQFVALIYLSYVKKMMHDASLFKDYTLQGLLDEFDVIECFEYPGQSLRVGEITKKQVELFNDLQITPSSLQ